MPMMLHPVSLGKTRAWAFREKSPGLGGPCFVEEIPGANTQGATLEEARENLKEAVSLVLEANRMLSEDRLRGAEVIREQLELPA